MDMRYGKERRGSKRITHVCEVECEALGLQKFTTRLNDLSITGAFIDSMTCYSTGTVLKLRFHIKDVLIETDAEVRYSLPRVGMGVQFLNLKPEHVAALESLIENKPMLAPAAPAVTSERREDKRIGYVCEVECKGEGLGSLVTRLGDLSVSGAFINSTRCYETGTVLAVRFHIGEMPIECNAEVRYAAPGKGMGVRFLDPKPEHTAALKSLIEGKPLALPPATGAPLVDKANLATASTMLTGNFAVVSMFDVIHLIENNRLSGALGVRSPAALGEVQFNEGQIVGARSGSKTGIEALKTFLDVTEGSFEFHRSSHRYPRTIPAANNTSLMLDLLRVKDEEAAGVPQRT
jgi:hypothetical protein